MTDEQRTTIGIDLGRGDETVAYVAFPDGKRRPLSRDRFDLVVAESAADRFDGLGKPMVDFYKP